MGSTENEEKQEGRKKSIEQDHARHSSGPVTRIVPIHMEGEEKGKTHRVPIKVTSHRRGRSESCGRRNGLNEEVPVKVTFSNMESNAFLDSNVNCDAFTQTFEGDKRNCVIC